MFPQHGEQLTIFSPQDQGEQLFDAKTPNFSRHKPGNTESFPTATSNGATLEGSEQQEASGDEEKIKAQKDKTAEDGTKLRNGIPQTKTKKRASSVPRFFGRGVGKFQNVMRAIFATNALKEGIERKENDTGTGPLVCHECERTFQEQRHLDLHRLSHEVGYLSQQPE